LTEGDTPLNPDVLTDPVANPEASASSAPARARSSLRDRAVWLIGRSWFWPTVITGVLGVARVWRPELWRDELRSWSAASRSIGDIFHLLGNTDAAVALYYLLLHYWMQLFGESATSMRLLSTLAMTGAAAGVVLVGQRLFDRRVAIFGGLIFAFIPAISRFAQEVRPYALTMLVAVFSTLLLLRALEKPGWLKFVWYGLSLTVLALTQIVAVPILAGHLVGVLLWRKDRATLVKWTATVALGLALAAPIVLLSMSQYDHQVGSLPDATIGELTRLPARLFMSSLLAGAVIILGVLAFTEKWRSAVFTAAWAVLPIGVVWVASNLGQSYWMSRYMLFTLPAFALLAGATLARINPRRIGIAGLAMLVVLGGQDQRAVRWLGSHDQWAYPDVANTAVVYSELANALRANMRPGDAIVYAGRDDYWLLDIGVSYHMRGEAQPRDVLVTESSLERGDFWASECADPAQCLQGVDRVFVVSVGLISENVFEYMEAEKAAALRESFEITRSWFPSGLNLVLMERTTN
jgi:mannosyltransferase